MGYYAVFRSYIEDRNQFLQITPEKIGSNAVDDRKASFSMLKISAQTARADNKLQIRYVVFCSPT